MPKVIDSESKVAYIYSSSTDKWHPIAGAVNTGAAYTWSADQQFSTTVTFESVVKAKAGVNNFLNSSFSLSFFSFNFNLNSISSTVKFPLFILLN